MDQFKAAFEASDSADVPFSLDPVPAVDTQVGDQLGALVDQIAQTLAQQAPGAWQHMGAVLAATPTHQAGRLAFAVDGQNVPTAIPADVWQLVRRHRELAASAPAGPWLRLLLDLTPQGQLNVSYDYGDSPFGEEFLFPPEAYKAEADTFGDRHIPLWLLAYTVNGGRQLRSPQTAAEQVRTDTVARVTPWSGDDDFPSMHELWTRWAALAAVAVARQTPDGPRILPGAALFEGASQSGSTFVRLPGDRAVLSGGIWEDPHLEYSYRNGEPLPDLYRGAPRWVSNTTLNGRIERGLLSFVYWYADGHWYRGQSPSSEKCIDALPLFWATDITARAIHDSIGGEQSESLLITANAYVAACESGTVTTALVETLLPRDRFDVDWALNQLSIAGCYRD